MIDAYLDGGRILTDQDIKINDNLNISTLAANKSYDNDGKNGLNYFDAASRISFFPIYVAPYQELNIEYSSNISLELGYYFLTDSKANVPNSIIKMTDWINPAKSLTLKVPKNANYFGICIGTIDPTSSISASHWNDIFKLKIVGKSDVLAFLKTNFADLKSKMGG